MATEPPADVTARLRRALRESLAARDTEAISALRSALSAIANAEAVPAEPRPPAQLSGQGGEHFVGAVSGLGAGEVERRSLSQADIDRLVATEIAERQAAAADYQRAGHLARAERLRREAQVLQSALTGPPRLAPP